MKQTIIVLASVMLLVIVSSSAYWIVKGYLPVPILLRHLYLEAIGTDDLYNTIATEDFMFYVEGYTKTINFKPKYLVRYYLGFFVDDSKIASRHEAFNGELKVDLYCKNKLLFTKHVGAKKGYGLPSNKHNYYTVYLTDFDIPFDRDSLKHLGLRVTVIKPDKYLEQFTNSIKLCVGVQCL